MIITARRIDIAHLNIAGTFYYLCTVLDGYSCSIVHWEIREAMTEQDVEILLQRAREKFPDARPRIISDNGPQFISRDFKQFLRLCGMRHVRTSPYYPQSNGKLERDHRTIKHDGIRQKTPLTLDEARRVVTEFVQHDNDSRLHSALGYITPTDKLAGLLWIIVVATQFSRYLITGDSLSAIKTSSYVNLVSRALIVPAVILSYLIVREREREPQAQA